MGEPPRGQHGPGRRPRAAKGGGLTVTGKSGRRRHAAQGAATSGRSFHVAVSGKL